MRWLHMHPQVDLTLTVFILTVGAMVFILNQFQ